MVEPWVLSQQRTMARWVSSKVSRAREIHDISVDLCDGLTLLELVNVISKETDACSYVLSPIYKKPTFALQKMENVDDILKFCRLVLQLNTCNISAEDVVQGNTKLILGLIWSLFVYSLARLVSKSESRSMTEIKSILLRWLNVTGKTKALPELTNFNKDWSLQQEKRPDLVFAAVLDFYVPKLVDYKKIHQGKKLSGLKEIISLAESSLGIPDLAVADDFNVLVPDEKCVLFYVLEWYMFFEVHKKEIPLDLILECRDISETAGVDLTSFFLVVLRAVKLKNKYDTKSLRLLNQLNFNLDKFEKRLEKLKLHNSTSNLLTVIDQFCAEINGLGDLEVQLTSRNELNVNESDVKNLQNILSESIKFKLDVKPAILYSDFPELKNLSKSLDLELKTGGFRCSYEPLKALSLESLFTKLKMLLNKEEKLCTDIEATLSKLFATNLKNIDQLICFVAKTLPKADKHASESVQKFTIGLETLLALRNQMHDYQIKIQQEHTTSDLKVLANSIEYYDLPPTPNTPDESQFMAFRQEVDSQINQSNLTYSDVKKFMAKLMSTQQMNGPEFQEFLRLIPTRAYLSRSESDDFGIGCHLDESEDSDGIFDRVLRTLECKLTGAQDKIYDLSLLISRMEAGFNV